MWSPKNFAWCGNHKAKLSIMAVMILFIIVSATILLDQHNILTEDLQKAVNEQETCRAQIEQDISDNRNNPDADQDFVDKNIRHLDVRDEDHPLFGHSPLPKLNVAVDDAEAALEAFSLGSNIFHMGTAMVASGSALVHAYRNNYENREFSRYHLIGFVLFLLAVVVGVLALSGIENVGVDEMRWVAIVVFSCVLGTKLLQCGSVFYHHWHDNTDTDEEGCNGNPTKKDMPLENLHEAGGTTITTKSCKPISGRILSEYDHKLGKIQSRINKSREDFLKHKDEKWELKQKKREHEKSVLRKKRSKLENSLAGATDDERYQTKKLISEINAELEKYVKYEIKPSVQQAEKDNIIDRLRKENRKLKNMLDNAGGVDI